MMIEVLTEQGFVQPVPTGHCAFPSTTNPAASHDRCQARGGVMRHRPSGLPSPCPCHCHLGEVYECECGGRIAEAPVLGLDKDGDIIYVHIDEKGNMTMEGCRS